MGDPARDVAVEPVRTDDTDDDDDALLLLILPSP